jgi:hypothetical protein
MGAPSINYNNKNSSNESKTGVSKTTGIEEDELIYDLVKARYNDALNHWNSLDNKASNLIGYVTIVTGLLVGIGTFDMFDKINLPILYILFFIGLVFLVLSITTSLITVKIRFYYVVPSAEEIEMIFNKNWKYRTIVRQTFIAMVDSLKRIDIHNNSKVFWLGWSWYFLVAGILTLVIFLIMFTLLR